MFKKLKEYISSIDRAAFECTGLENPLQEDFSYSSKAYELAVANFTDEEVLVWINREIKMAINHGEISPYSKTDSRKYYLFRIKIPSCSNGYTTVLFEENLDCNTDSLMIYGFDGISIIRLEWEIIEYRSDETKEIEFDNAKVFSDDLETISIGDLKMFFQSIEVKSF